ncbi:MAG: hypothetical protein EOP02_09290 [Proteobacteria bacterium]|nr:MAG: hypothetical protein EOP02_09290 [Pseudomonadota bacterium]
MTLLTPEKQIESARKALMHAATLPAGTSLTKECEALQKAITNAFQGTSRHTWAGKLAAKAVPSDNPLSPNAEALLIELEHEISKGLITKINANDPSVEDICGGFDGTAELLEY